MFTKNQWDGQDYDLIAAQKQMKKMVDDKAADILNDLPDLLRPIIAEAAKELAEQTPEILKQPDSVTHDAMDENMLRMRLIFAVSNALGHGANWLK
ncbi:hypothetical protein [Escherichia coli]|uniref:hypothetical protein n=1 Tax=Escherichia coli TaxID=562 RepID=UPI0004DA906F|nr:hypothetical protein [Escherichia coli]KDT76781.1 hypothetical protein AC59_0157 [Escherichia coli 3-373-03_S3_C3]KDU11000.1 hypothetical protein AC34_2339 [Escherichia coli 3-373-03_S3_C2]